MEESTYFSFSGGGHDILQDGANYVDGSIVGNFVSFWVDIVAEVEISTGSGAGVPFG